MTLPFLLVTVWSLVAPSYNSKLNSLSFRSRPVRALSSSMVAFCFFWLRFGLTIVLVNLMVLPKSSALTTVSAPWWYDPKGLRFQLRCIYLLRACQPQYHRSHLNQTHQSLGCWLDERFKLSPSKRLVSSSTLWIWMSKHNQRQNHREFELLQHLSHLFWFQIVYL